MDLAGKGKTYDHIKNVYRKWEHLIVLIIPALLIGGILFGTGNVFAGWHWVDDHETYRFLKLYKAQHVPLVSVIQDSLRSDISTRWRPLYWVFRVAMSYLFGDHPAIYKFALIIAGTAAYAFLYWGVRNLQCTVGVSHLFTLLVLFGRQFEVWYRVANQENLGILFCSVCFWLITKQYRDNVFHRKTDILIAVFAVCCGLMKESFVLMIPAFIWLRVGLEAARNMHSLRDVFTILKKNILFIIFLMLFFLANIYVIVVRVGVNQNGYAGLEESYGIKDYIWAMQRLCKDSLHSYVLLAYVILGVTLLWLGFLFLSKRVSFDMDWILFLVLLLFGAYIVLSQMVLHAKGGMWNRYLLPGIVGFAVIFIVCTDLIMKNTWPRIVMGLIAAVFLVGRLKLSVVDMSDKYVQGAKAVNRLYDVILERTGADAKIVEGFDNEEADLSFGIFMELKGRPYVYKYDYEGNQAADIFGEHTEKSILLDKADVFVSWTEDEEENEALLRSYGNWDRFSVMETYDVYVKR